MDLQCHEVLEDEDVTYYKAKKGRYQDATKDQNEWFDDPSK